MSASLCFSSLIWRYKLDVEIETLCTISSYNSSLNLFQKSYGLDRKHVDMMMTTSVRIWFAGVATIAPASVQTQWVSFSSKFICWHFGRHLGKSPTTHHRLLKWCWSTNIDQSRKPTNAMANVCHMRTPYCFCVVCLVLNTNVPIFHFLRLAFLV